MPTADATPVTDTGYRRPPREITDVLDAPPPPAVVVSPTREHLLLVQGERYPAVAELAAPMLRLAGLRINPQTNGPHTAHTLNRVPAILIDGPAGVKLKDGRLADVAPTLLALMGFEQPAEMTGVSLLEREPALAG